MYETIVFPTDGSETSLQAADKAFEYGERFDAEVHIIYVVQFDEALVLTDPHMGVAIEETDFEQQGENAVESAEEAASEYDVDVTTSILQGSGPHTEICEYATEIGADLIIMGTHGWSGAKRVLLGSTTERVIRKTERPVLTVQVGDD